MNAQTANKAKSLGHLVFNDVYEYFRYGNIVYRAPIEADTHKHGDLNGIRINARFYCTMNSWIQSPIMRGL